MASTEPDGADAVVAIPPATTAQWAAYYGLLPLFCAVLPVLLPWPLVFAAGYRAAGFGSALPALPFWIVGALWARPVLVAAADDLGRRLDTGEVPEPFAVWTTRTLAVVTWLLILLLPLRYGAVHAHAERARLRRTSREALANIRQGLAERRDEWYRDNGPGKAFELDDPRFDPNRFGGPFAPTPENPIGKLVFNEEGVAFYILDRPRGTGPGAVDWLIQAWHEFQRWVSRSTERGGVEGRSWVYERGLLDVPAGAPLPATTVWDIPILRINPLGHGLYWYVAGRPEG